MLLNSVAGILSIQSQNLVPNPGFEEFDECPSGHTQLARASEWFSPILTSPDYFHGCDCPGQMCVPDLLAGEYYHEAHGGEAFGGIYVYYDVPVVEPDYREYLCVRLKQPLRAQRVYEVSFYVVLAVFSELATDAVGALFTEDSIQFSSQTVLITTQPQIENQSGNFITDTANWVLVKDTFIANGGETFMTIGNFHPNSQTDTMKSVNEIMFAVSQAYMLVDDVSVIEIGIHNSAPTLQGGEMAWRISPVPARNTVTFEQISHTIQPFQVELRNALGQLVVVSPVNTGSRWQLQRGSLPTGMYFYQIQDAITKETLNLGQIIFQ